MGDINNEYWLENKENMMHSAESFHVEAESPSQAEAEPLLQPEVDYLDRQMLLMIPVRLTVRQYMEWFTWNCHVCGARGNRAPPPYTPDLFESDDSVANVLNTGWRAVQRVYKRICSWASRVTHGVHICPGDSSCGDGTLGHRGPCEKCTLSASIDMVSRNGETIEFPGGNLTPRAVPMEI